MATASPVEIDPGVEEDLTLDAITLADTPWVTVVWNDPVNLMSYVSYVFTKYFGYSKKKAEKLMLLTQLHPERVASAQREHFEMVESIRSRDISRAKAVARKHFNINDILKNSPFHK